LFGSVQAQGQNVPEMFRREALAVSNPQQAVKGELIEARLQRALYSDRQLEEVLVDFWLNHFNVYSEKGQVRWFLPSYERDAIRPHVLGKFRDMLLATARHPAMLFYLDNYNSRSAPENLPQGSGGTVIINGAQQGLNENYGREVMELHTLGVNGGYTQKDVINVARAFTGWTIFDPQRWGEFQFNPQMHDRGEKVVLSLTLPRGGGEDEGVKVIDLLARHPATARFISRKLAQRFVADDPPQALIDRMAATFTKTDGDLRAVTETLLLSREFLSDERVLDMPVEPGAYEFRYVQGGSKFFVAKVDSKKVRFENGMAQLSPLRFHYDSETFALPVRLGLVSGMRDAGKSRACERTGTDDQRITACDGHPRDPVFAARSASHHQIPGNAAEPYSGSFSGRPKRFQRAARVLL